MNLEDLVSPLGYENKIVAFFDILGWKDKIARAGTDRFQIGMLKTVVKIFTVFGNGFDKGNDDRLVTSFSDNVVCSIPFDMEEIQSLVESLSKMQFGLATLGFFLRGSITIGDIHHSNFSVFGPALNRAYELESRFANYPRIILDPEVAQLNCAEQFTRDDGDFRIIDVFDRQAIRRILIDSGTGDEKIEGFSKLNLKGAPIDGAAFIGNEGILVNHVLNMAVREYHYAPDDKSKNKMLWVIEKSGIALGIQDVQPLQLVAAAKSNFPEYFQ